MALSRAVVCCYPFLSPVPGDTSSHERRYIPPMSCHQLPGRAFPMVLLSLFEEGMDSSGMGSRSRPANTPSGRSEGAIRYHLYIFPALPSSVGVQGLPPPPPPLAELWGRVCVRGAPLGCCSGCWDALGSAGLAGGGNKASASCSGSGFYSPLYSGKEQF